MLFNIFGSRKGDSRNEIDKKCKAEVTSSSDDNIKMDFESEDDIHIILGENIKKSRFTSEFHDQSSQQ